jgi:hypothetical protein
LSGAAQRRRSLTQMPRGVRRTEAALRLLKSALGVMAITYPWICTACASTNTPGRETCHSCGCPAITSGIEATTWVKGGSNSQMSGWLRLLIGIGAVAGISASMLLWVFNPPDMLWWLGLVILFGIFVLGGAARWMRPEK